jgi:hypothetical protein
MTPSRTLHCESDDPATGQPTDLIELIPPAVHAESSDPDQIPRRRRGRIALIAPEPNNCALELVAYRTGLFCPHSSINAPVCETIS